MFSRNLQTGSTIFLFGMMMSFVGCGDKNDRSPRAPSQKSGDASGLTNTVCDLTDRTKCPKLNPRFTGVESLGGHVGQVLSWNIEASAPEDPKRIFYVALHDQSDLKEGMDVRSQSSSEELLINWKTTKPTEQETIRFKARDVTRCQVALGDRDQCVNMAVFLEDFDVVSNYNYQILEAAEEASSDEKFYSQVKCGDDVEGKKKFGDDYFEKAGVKVLAETVQDGLSKEGNFYDAAVENLTEGLVNGVKDLADYWINGDEVQKKSDEECMRENE